VAYNYLILDLYHYLILVFICEYVHGYVLNIVNIHSILCVNHSSTKYGMKRLCSDSTLQSNKK
jgi:hypothetical protein